ncbi:MAG TPA: threonine synthase [Bacillota bacterium]
MFWPGLIAHYRPWLPIDPDDTIVTLQEGNTPLVPARRLARLAGLEGAPGLDRLYLKYEGANPTGSFKDRGMTVAVSKAVSAGARTVICASTGNTSASAAAYAAAAGIEAVVVLPKGAVARGKLAQALVFGARLLPIRGNFDQALAIVRDLAAEHPGIALVNSVNPLRLEGQKTIAFEITDQLAAMGEPAPAVVALPVGNAGNITAAWMGFRQLHEAGRLEALPRMVGVQAEGAAPLVHGRPVDQPETVASAIRIGKPASAEGARRAVNESGGRFLAVSDEEILAAQGLIARATGVFCEPASAASVAGILALARLGELGALLAGPGNDSGGSAGLRPGGTGRGPGDAAGGPIVCVLTGNGLKDTDAVIAGAVRLPEALPADRTRIAEVLLGVESSNGGST